MNKIPVPSNQTGRAAMRALLRQRHILAALETVHADLGDIFRLPLPGFAPIMMVGPEANRMVLVQEKENLLWRAEADPVTRLLRHGMLVEDGESHDALRREVNPSLHRSMLETYVAGMWQATNEVIATWEDGLRKAREIDMLDEMRRLALLILTRTLFAADIGPQLESLWNAILRTIKFISPGIWLIWPNAPRPGYARARQEMDGYLYALIAARRAQMGSNAGDEGDLLGSLIASGMGDDLIRDQLLTMLIAGHDTSTALLAWALLMLAEHQEIQERAFAEADALSHDEPPAIPALASLETIDRVIKETLRLYPPIHLGSRIAATEIEFQGYRIPAGKRVLYSIYLSHRHPAHWEEPSRFLPDRFAPELAKQRPPYLYLPFGGGQRNCVGTAFAQVEAKIVLARILQRVALAPSARASRPRMGATLEPQPGAPVLASSRRREKMSTVIAGEVGA
jgi:cytochrome P450